MDNQITELSIELVKAGIKFIADENWIKMGDVSIRWRDKEGYRVFSNKRYENIEQHDLDKMLRLDEKNMFKLNLPKIIERVKIIEAKIKEADRLDAKNKAKKEALINKLQNEGARFYYGKFEQGEINRNCLRYCFAIRKDGDLYHKIEISMTGAMKIPLKFFKNYLKMAWKDKLNRYTILILVWYILIFLINLILKLA